MMPHPIRATRINAIVTRRFRPMAGRWIRPLPGPPPQEEGISVPPCFPGSSRFVPAGEPGMLQAKALFLLRVYHVNEGKVAGRIRFRAPAEPLGDRFQALSLAVVEEGAEAA